MDAFNCYLGGNIPNRNVLFTDKESNNPSHMIDTLMCVCMLRLVNHTVCAHVQNLIIMICVIFSVQNVQNINLDPR